jgi:uncharacterized protein (DUF4415 family)
MSAKPVVFDEDNPEWTAQDVVRAKRGDDIPAHIRKAFPNTRPRGRPKGSTKPDTKQQVTLRLDPEVIEGFRASGPGWQGRINEALRAALGR